MIKTLFLRVHKQSSITFKHSLIHKPHTIEDDCPQKREKAALKEVNAAMELASLDLDGGDLEESLRVQGTAHVSLHDIAAATGVEGVQTPPGPAPSSEDGPRTRRGRR